MSDVDAYHATKYIRGYEIHRGDPNVYFKINTTNSAKETY